MSKIKYYSGTVFNSGAKTLVNTVNCKGVMGAGIALEFKFRYPKMYEKYVLDCEASKYKTGEIYLFKDINEDILNFPTKDNWKYPSNIRWVSDGLDCFVKSYKSLNIKSIAFPKLGTSKGGLDWNVIKKLMEEKLSGLDDIEIIICLDDLTEAEGEEKRMLDSLNVLSIEALHELKNSKGKPFLKTEQVDIIYGKRPFSRFWKLQLLPKIGKKTYENMFLYFYKKNVVEQSLF